MTLLNPPQGQPVVLVTVSGPDVPGITAQLTGVLAETQTPILDIGQAVIHGWLSLSILFEMSPENGQGKTALKDLLFKAAELKLKLEFQLFDSKSMGTQFPVQEKRNRYAVTLIAEPVTAQALHQVAAILGQYKMNIDEIRRLSEKDFGCLEILTSSNGPLDQALLKKELLEIASRQKVDIGLQAEGLFRRAKRLVVMDMDSTLIQNEVIDEIARKKGVYDEVSAITELAMQGKKDFD
jgi:phosphoserine phosphatase